jgi:transcriptional regulator with XRE-family HTH domain
MTDEEARQHFSIWLNEELQRRGWTQGKLISQSGTSDEERLSSAAVSRYSTGKMLPDIASYQKIARALDLPVEFVLRKAKVLDPLPDDIDWIQKSIDDLANAIEAGQISEEGRMAIVTHIQRERQIIQAMKENEQQALSGESTGA